MSLLESIAQAKEFGIWLHDKTNNKNIPSGIRVRTGVSILQLSLDINDAILVLLDARLSGPALTLARPLFESYVRAVWLMQFALDEEIDKFNKGICPKFPEILKAIGNDKISGGAWIHATKIASWGFFNDLTHGGREHVIRRLTQESVEPNYPETELEALVQLGIEVRIRVGAEFMSLLNDEIAMDQLKEKSQSLRISHSQGAK